MEQITAIIVAALSGSALSTLITQIFAARKEKREEEKGTKEGLRLILKDRLRFLCGQYIAQGWIYQDEMEDLITMHDCYHEKLEGNGYLDTLMSKVKMLEVRGVGK